MVPEQKRREYISHASTSGPRKEPITIKKPNYLKDLKELRGLLAQV